MTTVQRTIDLDIDAGRLWRAVADPDELLAWLAADGGSLDLRPGGRGWCRDGDGLVRSMVVDEVVDGERLVLRWSDGTASSRVGFLVERTAGGARLTVTETLLSVRAESTWNPPAGVPEAGNRPDAAATWAWAKGAAWAERLDRLAAGCRAFALV